MSHKFIDTALQNTGVKIKTRRMYDLVRAVRRRRFQWLGHILRMQDINGKVRLVKVALKVQFDNDRRGNLLQDAPAAGSFDELILQAQDHKHWDKLRDSI